MLAELVDLVLPRSCIGCARGGSALCSRCRSPDVQRVELDDLGVVAGARYEGAVRAALLAYKERGRRDLTVPLAALLAAAMREIRAGPAVLVPVPSTSAARRARGGDHVERLARAAVRGQVRPVLQIVRSVRDSAGLDIADRSANLHAAMSASPPRGPSDSAVIVDDIVTTGATLRESARALRVAGWSVCGAAVVAATPRRHPQRARIPPGDATSGRSARAGLT